MRHAGAALAGSLKELLTIGSSCIFVNHKEVFVCHTWDVTGSNSQSFMTLILINQFLHGLGLLLACIIFAFLGSSNLDWYFLSLSLVLLVIC